MQHGPAAPVDGARVLAVQGHDIAAPACRVLEIEVCKSLPATTETDDLNAVLAAAVGYGLYDRVEASDITAASENADTLSRHDQTLNRTLRTRSVSIPFSVSSVGLVVATEV